MVDIKDINHKGRITAKTIMADAEDEINEEAIKEYKSEVKRKLKSLRQARFIVKNIEREIEDLEIAINEKLA